ncbi:protein peste-like [Epargyreus clarus]|uniref:protein peste-like n=1 Tax=Epargyreus clarus TaxID=520877 RepID=UPI003C2C1CFE
MRGRTPRCRRAVTAVAALFTVAALVTAFTWNAIFEAALSSQIALTPTSRSYREWVAPTVPLYFDVYLFNWTNAANFPEEAPNLVQLGPYRFRETRSHVNVTWHPNNASMGYRTQRSWHFDPSSKGSLQDNVTIINVIAASAVYRLRDAGFLSQKALAMALAMYNHRFSVSKLAGELLFDGYNDELLDWARLLPASLTGGAPPVDKFGFFYGRNNSVDTDGYVETSTGTESGILPGQIRRWNYQDHLPFYEGECSKLEGSVGEFFPHNLTERSELAIFMPDLCRTVYLQPVGSGEHGGLPYHKYALSDTSFDNSTTNIRNTCYCNGECGFSGVMNVSACRYGSPSFISLPHFLYGDPQLRELVHGLDPDPEKHSFYFAVEPKLGIPLDVTARFQLNIYIEPTPYITLFEKIPKMMFPVLWVEQSVKVEEKILQELRTVRAILDWGGTVSAFAALVLAGLTILSCYFKPHCAKADKVNLEKPKDEAEVKLNPMYTLKKKQLIKQKLLQNHWYKITRNDTLAWTAGTMIGLLLTLAAAAAFTNGEEEIMKNLTTVTWAHAVNNKTYLEAALASEVSMLEADIVLGHINGKEGPPTPIMAHPPATTSDLTLGDFLNSVLQYNNVNSKQKGVKLDFKSIEAFEKSQDHIAQFSKPEITFPLWLNADILPGPVDAKTKPVDPVKFLKLGANHPRAVLSIGWTTNYGGNITEGEYSREQIGSMLRLVNENHVNQTVTFPVRAGLASNSQPVLLDLLRETSSLNSSMTVWSSEGDAVEVDRVRALILTVGLERTYLDVPPELATRLHLPPADTKTKN